MEDRSREVRLSWKETQRLTVLEEVRSGRRTQMSAAQALGVTDRWIRKLLQRLEQEGAAGLAHRLRGRPSPRRIGPEVGQRVIQLYRDKYEGFNLTHFGEMLRDREGLKPPCREVLRRLLMGPGLWQRRRKAPKHRLRRPRREHAGEMLQLDASIHRWLGPDQDPIALVGAVDDATGEAVEARFFAAETTQAYLTILAGIVHKKGIPRAWYTDRDSVFIAARSTQAELLRAQGQEPRTQVGRALKELGIEWIAAYSPQAKGRIERLWKTCQDRLLHELRLEGIQTLEEANRYLKGFLARYNRDFRVRPAHPESVYRPAPSWRVLQGVLCCKESRILARDHTFSLEGTLWQVLPSAQVLALTGRRIEVRRPLRGPLQAWYGDHRLTIRPAPAPAPRMVLRAAEPSYPVQGRVRL